MDGDYGCLAMMLLILFAAIVGGVGVFFEWQAYVQAMEIAGAEPNISAFIGWMIAFGGNQ